MRAFLQPMNKDTYYFGGSSSILDIVAVPANQIAALAEGTSVSESSAKQYIDKVATGIAGKQEGYVLDG